MPKSGCSYRPLEVTMRIGTALLAPVFGLSALIGSTMLFTSTANGDPVYICPDGRAAMALGTQAAVDNPPLPLSPMESIPAPQTFIEVQDGTLTVKGGDTYSDGQLTAATMYVCPTETKPSRSKLVHELNLTKSKLQRQRGQNRDSGFSWMHMIAAAALAFVLGSMSGYAVHKREASSAS